MKISIIIPTHNRCENLKFLLESLKNLRLADPIKCEVLVIDNNSSDSTKHVTANYLFSEHPTFRYIFEKRQGKSYALNTGVKEADGDVLVFTDDDCIPDPNWLVSIVREFEDDFSLSMLGGRVELASKNDIPVTTALFKERIRFSCLSQLFSPPLIIGCNMAIRRRVLDTVTEFDPVIGPGTKFKAIVDDIDFLYRVYKNGFKIVYSPEVLVFHNHGRKTRPEATALMHRYLRGRGAFYCKHILRSDHDVLRMALDDLHSVLTNLIKVRSVKWQIIKLGELLFGGIYYFIASSFRGVGSPRNGV